MGMLKSWTQKSPLFFDLVWCLESLPLTTYMLKIRTCKTSFGQNLKFFFVHWKLKILNFLHLRRLAAPQTIFLFKFDLFNWKFIISSKIENFSKKYKIYSLFLLVPKPKIFLQILSPKPKCSPPNQNPETALVTR